MPICRFSNRCRGVDRTHVRGKNQKGARMGLDHRREELPDDEPPRRYGPPRRRVPGGDSDAVAHARIRRGILRKIWRAQPVVRADFGALLASLLDQEWQDKRFGRLMLTNDGFVAGIPLVASEPAWKWDFRPRPIWMLCRLDYAIETICESAIGWNLTHAERAYLLNKLPCWPEHADI